jgi:hypothetical protein
VPTFNNQLTADERLGTDPRVNAELNHIILEARQKLRTLARRQARNEHEFVAMMARVDSMLQNAKRYLSTNVSH